MPAIQRGSAYRVDAGRWGLRYYDEHGVRRRKSPFASKSAALAWYREHIEPTLRGERPATVDHTLAAFVAIYLERHEAAVRARTISTLRDRLGHATRAFGTVPLSELERMTDELAGCNRGCPSARAMGSHRRCAKCSTPPCAGST